MTMEACAVCPHQSDCLRVGSCLDELNAPAMATRQFPRMTPEQANRLTEAFRAGQTRRRFSGSGKSGTTIASLTNSKPLRLIRNGVRKRATR